MDLYRVVDVGLEDVDSLIYLCIPSSKRNEPYFIEGAKVKRAWAFKSLNIFGSIAKIAYSNSIPVGLIQYQPNIENKVLEISCIFVPDKRYQRKGIGRALLNSLMEDVKKPMKIFGYKFPYAIIAHAFNVPGYYPQSEFYLKMGFKRVEGNSSLLYYPLKEGYTYKLRESRFIPQLEDMGKAIIFYDPSCPFCISFSKRIEDLIREVAPNLPIRFVNIFEEVEEVKKRGEIPICAVDGKPIKAFFMDKMNFQNEIREVLQQCCNFQMNA